MYELLKQICLAQSIPFIYARKDFANLYDEIETNKPYVFLDPVEIEDIINDNGETEREIHSGSFMLAYSSDLDSESYEQKFEENIKPLLEIEIKKIKEEIVCSGIVEFRQWRKVEFVNAFDYNLDGIIVLFNLEINND